MSTLTLEHNTLVVQTPYNPALVASIKSLPYADRKWDNNRKVWLVTPQHGAKLAAWILECCNEMVLVPQSPRGNLNIFPALKMLEVHYIGTCKQRDDGTTSAFAWVDNEWKAIFSEAVLREWFDKGPAQPTGQETLYQILGITSGSDKDEIKKAYRRMARLWHPDVCKEANATERFQRINAAYELLSDPIKQAKYDAGLALERMTFSPRENLLLSNSSNYRSPLLCGMILAEATEVLGRFVVNKILEWQDITRNGYTLVSSWPMGAKAPVEHWV